MQHELLGYIMSAAAVAASVMPLCSPAAWKGRGLVPLFPQDLGQVLGEMVVHGLGDSAVADGIFDGFAVLLDLGPSGVVDGLPHPLELFVKLPTQMAWRNPQILARRRGGKEVVAICDVF